MAMSSWFTSTDIPKIIAGIVCETTGCSPDYRILLEKQGDAGQPLLHLVVDIIRS